MARPSQGDVAAISAVRRFELQYNQSPRYARRRAERRQGQALLLAVLIMVLAALLSAGFLAVVSGNLNQSARIADKTRAIEASRAGIAYANAQLSGSSQGDLWRPVDVSPAPDPNDSNDAARYDNYYSQLDKVQGWANTLAKTDPLYRDAAYGKFPDPTQPVGDAPKFLVKVQQLPTNLPTTDAEYAHRGEIKITSIGLSDDDPNVFHRAVAYKEGRRKSPLTRALRSVSNWDWKNNLVPQGTVSAVTPNVGAGTTTVTVADANVKGVFPSLPFNVVLSHKDPTATNSKTFGGVVTALSAGTGTTTYTVTGEAAAGDFVAGDTMQVAAALGTAQTIDLLNTGNTPTYPLTASEPLLFPMQNQPNGVLANGSLWLQGQYQLTSLQKTGSKIQSAGALFLSNRTPVSGKDAVPVSGDVATAGDLAASSSPTFPGSFDPVSGTDKTDLIDDGWNKLGSVKTLGLEYIPDQTRTVRPFTPVKIDSATNLARYRALTRNSDNGVYINNRDDVEKVGTNAMTQAQLLEMLNSSASVANTDANNYVRVGQASPIADTTRSLEQKHLRGWVGPDEFLARGALVELVQPTGANPFIRVTYDARSDTNPNGPDPNKAWRGANGNVQTGVYSKELPWPKNGTLFAEGNVRIRGSVNLRNLTTGTDPADFPSLTVVSLNNIYIEGTLSVDDALVGTAPNQTPDPARKKLMLLAKKNVIVNPTRLVLGHVDAQTVSTAVVNVAVGANTALPVAVGDSSDFRVGDRISIDTTIAVVTATTSATQIEVSTNNGTAAPIAIPANSPVKLAQWKDDYTQASRFFKVDANQSINRRVLLQNAATDYPNLRLDLDHAGSRPAAADIAFNIKTAAESSGKPTGLAVKVTNKRVDANGTVDPHKPIIERDDKKLRATYNQPNAPGVDVFRDPAAPDFTDEADAKTFSLKQLEDALDNTSHVETPVAPASKGWKYDATKTNTTLADETPAFYLAAVGLRNDKFSSAPPAADNGVKDIGPDGTEINIPLATSIRLTRNGTQQNLISTYTGLNMGTGTEEVAEYTVPFFGFNPEFGVVAGGEEDILTVDQSFYQTNTEVLNSTLDSRRLASPFATGEAIILRQNDDLLGLAAGITTPVLPLYRVRALKLENTKFPAPATTDALIIQPISLDIDAYVYAQEGSWLLIPGDYFRSAIDNAAGKGNAVRSNAGGTASYIDFSNDGNADAGEYVDVDGTGTLTDGDFADLNRNGIADPGELEAALRFVRYNYTINFYGAIVENQTAVVADVANPMANQPPLVNGAVQDWMNKWAAYDSTSAGTNADPKWKLISYAYDPSLAIATPATNQLRVPVTDELLYQQ